jgi:hypothetical protein
MHQFEMEDSHVVPLWQIAGVLGRKEVENREEREAE